MPPERDIASARIEVVDPWLRFAVLALVCIGILMVYSASVTNAYITSGSPYYYAEREILWALIGVISIFVASRVDYHRWQPLALPFFVVSVALLCLVLVPHIGTTSNGARRWFSLGAGVTIEPSEIMKLALVMYLATWLPSKGQQIRDFSSGFLPFGALVGCIFLLIFKQPDLGTASVVALTAVCIFFVAGADLLQLCLVVAGTAGGIWLIAQASSYQRSRISVFMDPWKHASGAGYHAVQAIMALGSGGIFGRGLGNSLQKSVLPAPHTDSILAVIGEEFGLLGTLSVLCLFLLVAYRGMRIASQAHDEFGRLLAVGITSWIMVQALLNFAVITSSVPFTGVPLPFISYGGSSLIITMTGMGVLLNISRHATGKGFARQVRSDRRRNRRPRISRTLDNPVPSRRNVRNPVSR